MLTKMQGGEDFAVQTKGGGRVVAPSVVAEPKFNPASAYAVDAKAWYDGLQYVCTAATTEPAQGQSNPTPEKDKAHWAALPAEEMAKKSEVDTLVPLLFAQYYPEGNVKSAAEFTPGIKYDDPDTVNRTITVKPFCNTGDSENDNSSLVGRVVIPPFVDAQGNGYISDDGTRFKVVGVVDGSRGSSQSALTAIIAPNTVTSIGVNAFFYCESLASVSLPAATSIKPSAFFYCEPLESVSLLAATSIGDSAFSRCAQIASVSLPAATNIGENAFYGCSSLASVDFGETLSSVPTLGADAFTSVPTACKIIVPYTQYDAWIAADGWRDLPQEFVRHAEKADKPATFTAGNLAKFDANGNPTDSQIPAADVALKGDIPYSLVTKAVDAGAVTLDDRASNAVEISATLSSNTLTINFPAAANGKARDFALRLNIAAGVTAPEIVWPQGVTLENDGGEMPEIADGGADGSSTILYFSETENDGTTAKFLVKGETLTAIAQA